MLKALLTLMLAYPIICWSPTCGAQSAQREPQATVEAHSPEIARRLKPGIVKLVAQDAAGNPFAMGYGFFIDPWTIVTNIHLLKDAKKKNADQFYIVAGDTKFYHVNYDTAYEKSGLLFLDMEERGLQPLPIGKTDKFTPGDRVYVIDVATFTKPKSPATDRLIEMTLPLPPEYSGLPVLDQSGLVLGIATDTRVKSAPASGVIPAKELADKIKRYLSYVKGEETEELKKPPDNSSGSFSAADSPTTEREAGGQSAVQPAGASKTPAAGTPGSLGTTSPPKVLKRVKARYTKEAMDAGINGDVLVSLILDEQGEIIKAKVVRGHPLLRLTSLRAARECRFTPAMKDGVPVENMVTMEFSFNIGR